MPSFLKDLYLKEVSMVDRPANKGSQIVLAKSQEGQPTLDEKGFFEKIEGILGRLIDTKITKKKEDAMTDEEKIKSLQEKIASLEEKLKGTEKSEIGKSDEAVAKVSKERDEALEKLQKFEADSAIQEIVKKELGDLKGISKSEDVAKAIHSLRKADKDSTEVLVSQIRALSKQAEEAGLFKELGSGKQPASPVEKLDSLAKAKAKELGISYAKAYTQVLTEHPELYDGDVSVKEA